MSRHRSGAHMTCLRCGLTIRFRAWYLTLAHCPRCAERHRVISPMALAQRPTPPVPRLLDVVCSERDGAFRLTLIGIVDVLSLPALRRGLRQAERGGSGRVVVDLDAVQSIADCGIDALIIAHDRARIDGRQLWVRTGSRRMRRRFEHAAGNRASDLFFPSVIRSVAGSRWREVGA